MSKNYEYKHLGPAFYNAMAPIYKEKEIIPITTK